MIIIICFLLVVVLFLKYRICDVLSDIFCIFLWIKNKERLNRFKLDLGK